jgi:hypothetical protein
MTPRDDPAPFDEDRTSDALCVNVSRWERDFKMARPRHPYAATNYDGDNPLRLAKKIDPALDKCGLGKRTPPVEDEPLATMTQQCRVWCRLRRPVWAAWPASSGSGQGELALKGCRWRCSTTTIAVEKHQAHRRVRLTTSKRWLCPMVGHIVIPQ